MNNENIIAIPNPNEQQALAANPNYSAWVSASAGSGKTKVLTDRFLNLLLSGCNPERILCLTYTKSAAAEMKERIEKRLSNWAIMDDVNLEKELIDLKQSINLKNKARKLFASMLEAPGGIKIMTIHAFCQSLLKRFPAEANISPNFKIIDDLEKEKFLKSSIDEIFSSPEYEEQINFFTNSLSQKVFDDIKNEIIEHLDYFEKLPNDFKEINDLYNKALDLKSDDTEISITTKIKQSLSKEDLETLINAFSNFGGVSEKKAVENLKNFENLSFYDLANIFLTKELNPRANFPTKAVSSKVPNTVDIIRDFQSILQKSFSKINGIKNKDYSLHVAKIGKGIANFYNNYKYEWARLDYNDLIQKTIQLLDNSSSKWIMFKLDNGIEHILVDEAQDTSPEQWNIIEKLTDDFFSGIGASQKNRTIFVVGDKKQSIYSFQGARPEKFVSKKNTFKEKILNCKKEFKDVKINTSFRSSQVIIDAVNDVLKYTKDNELLGIIDNGELEFPTHYAGKKFTQNGIVEIWDLEKPEEINDDEFDASQKRKSFTTPVAKCAINVANKIYDLINNEKELLPVVDKDNNIFARKINAGDILVLVKRRTNFVDILTRELKKRNIDIAGADRLNLTDHIAIKDLMVLGDFLLYPNDDLALATILRSPLCGCSEEELFYIAVNRGKNTLWISLKDRFYDSKNQIEFLDEFIKDSDKKIEIYNHLNKTYLYLKELLNLVDTITPFELYSYILNALDGQNKFVSRMGIQVIDPLDEFLNKALEYEKKNVPTLQLFLRDLRNQSNEIKRDMEQSGSAVRIMTVHGSKGLQAPIVFLPDTYSIPLKKRKNIMWNDNLPLCSLTSEEMSDQLKALNEQSIKREEEEYRRLLYVAITRPADRLYICGWKTKKDVENNWHSILCGSLLSEKEKLNLIKTTQTNNIDEIKPNIICQRSITWKADNIDIINNNYSNNDIEFPDYLNKPYEASNDEEQSTTATDRGNVHFSKEAQIAMLRGTLIHKILEFLPSIETDKQEFKIKQYLQKHNQYDQLDNNLYLSNTILSIVQNPQYFPLFSKDSQAEAPITGYITGKDKNGNNVKKLINGVIDRLAINDDKVMICDYKSGYKHKSTPKAYLDQLHCYKTLIKEIYPNKDVHTYILWCEKPELEEIF